MEVWKKEILVGAGIDVDEALARFMGKEGLLVRMLTRFLEDTTFLNLQSAIARKNTEDFLQASHTLKGLCSNLSMKRLALLFSRKVELICRGEIIEAEKMQRELLCAYQRTTDAIRYFLSEKDLKSE